MSLRAGGGELEEAIFFSMIKISNQYISVSLLTKVF